MICSLGGPQSQGSPVVVFLDRGYPRFWNFYSTHPVDVVRVKSYMNCLFDSARVVLRVTINEGKFDTTILREPDGQLTTSVYRKPTHTDQYLAYDSHHPRSVKRGIVKCLTSAPKVSSHVVFKSETTLRPQLVQPKDDQKSCIDMKHSRDHKSKQKFPPSVISKKQVLKSHVCMKIKITLLLT